MSFGIAPQELIEEIDSEGFWPYSEPQRHWDNNNGGEWTLWMSRGAAIVMWPESQRDRKSVV